MNIQVKQRSIYQGEGWWQWSIWLDGPEQDLDQIEYVEYRLHSTFPKPVRRITNRNTKFRLSTAGWGEFMIYMEIKPRNRKALRREHWLQLEYPTGEGERAPRRARERPVLFLSFGIADMPFASALGGALDAKGIDVLTTEDVKPGLPLQESLTSVVERADIAVVIVSDKQSPWIMREIEAVREHKIPLTPVIVGPDADLPDPLRGLKGIRVKDVAHAERVAEEVAERISRIAT